MPAEVGGGRNDPPHERQSNASSRFPCSSDSVCLDGVRAGSSICAQRRGVFKRRLDWHGRDRPVDLPRHPNRLKLQLDGWVTYRALYPCTGAGSGFSYNAAVNVQDDVAETVWQVGIIRDDNSSAHFAYASVNPNAVEISSPTPTIGQRYDFRIWRSAGNNVRLAIYNSSGTRIWALTSTTWTSSMKHGWWGWETQNSEDMPGYEASDSSADLVGQISRNGDGVAPYDVTGISPFASCPIHSCSYYWPATLEAVSGQSNQILNVKTP